jgi:regulator of replication initiation timing
VTFVKRRILRGIERLGYVVLKAPDFEQQRRDADADRCSEMDTELSRLRSEIEGLQEDVASLLRENAALIREVNALDQRHHEANAKYREASDQLSEALAEVRRLSVAVEELPPIDHQVLREHQAKLAGFGEVEPAFEALYDRTKSWATTTIEQLFAVYQAVQYLVKANIPGDVVECGCGDSGFGVMAALALMAKGDTSRRLVIGAVDDSLTYGRATVQGGLDATCYPSARPARSVETAAR